MDDIHIGRVHCVLIVTIKNTIMKTHLYAILIFSLSLGCRENVQEPGTPNTYILSYGQSFGFCIGYCDRELVYSDTKIVKTLIPTNFAETQLDTITCSVDFNSLPELQAKLNASVFFEMAEVIGCPDCADGGAEWIQLATEGRTKRVTFPYNDAPSEFSQIIEDLRTHHDELGQCD